MRLLKKFEVKDPQWPAMKTLEELTRDTEPEFMLLAEKIDQKAMKILDLRKLDDPEIAETVDAYRSAARIYHCDVVRK